MVEKIDLNQRLAMASGYRKQGYNCAQTVAMTFSDVIGVSAEEAARMSTGFGGGVGGCGEICGVASAFALVVGMVSDGAPESKAQVYKEVSRLVKEFTNRFGSCVCRTLKTRGSAVPCNELIAEGVRMLCNWLSARQ